MLLVAGCAGRGPVQQSTELECVPFARAESGITLYGDAADWWDQAAGRYDRGPTPAPGAVLVFHRSSRLPHGHVSVVTGVAGPRDITVDQANWVRGRIGRAEAVRDMSAGNDWSTVRVWWAPSGTLGATAYAAQGFVGPR